MNRRCVVIMDQVVLFTHCTPPTYACALHCCIHLLLHTTPHTPRDLSPHRLPPPTARYTACLGAYPAASPLMPLLSHTTTALPLHQFFNLTSRRRRCMHSGLINRSLSARSLRPSHHYLYRTPYTRPPYRTRLLFICVAGTSLPRSCYMPHLLRASRCASP